MYILYFIILYPSTFGPVFFGAPITLLLLMLIAQVDRPSCFFMDVSNCVSDDHDSFRLQIHENSQNKSDPDQIYCVDSHGANFVQHFVNTLFLIVKVILSVCLHSMLLASLPSHSLRSSKGISLLVSRGKTNTDARAFHSCAPSLWNNLLLSVSSAISVAALKKHLKTHLFDVTFPLYAHAQPMSPLMPWNCLINFAIAYWFGCRASKPGVTGDIGTTKIWLIDWEIDRFHCLKRSMNGNILLTSFSWHSNICEGWNLIFAFLPLE